MTRPRRGGSFTDAMCPHCGQAAPLVYRGVVAYCSACGQLRGPLTGASVTHAGSVSKVGGVMAKVAAWLSFAVGALLFLLFGPLLTWWIPAAMVAVVTLTVFGLLMWGGRSLIKSGAKSAADTKSSAVFSMAATRKGELRGIDLMQALNVSKEEGDLLLDEMSKAHPEDIVLEVDDQGGLYYVFPRFRQRVATRIDGSTVPAQASVVDPLLEEFAALEAQEAEAKKAR